MEVTTFALLGQPGRDVSMLRRWLTDGVDVAVVLPRVGSDGTPLATLIGSIRSAITPSEKSEPEAEPKRAVSEYSDTAA